MFKQKIKHSARAVTDRISSTLRHLVRDEAASGKLLLLASLTALVCTNSPLFTGFEQFWQQHFTLNIGAFTIDESFRGIVNEGLMAIFFLVVGLEIKREVVLGELRKLRAASLPIAAAIGGMAVPALFYIAINAGHTGFSGWGIPMATDIAFAVGILTLISRRVPASLKLFLLTLAVVDDIGAVIVITIFYTSGLQLIPLLLAAFIVVSIIAFNRLGKLTLPMFILLGILLWLALYSSGIHASIAGVLLGLVAPIATEQKPLAGRTIAERLEKSLIPLSTFFVIPLFALANAGVAFNFGVFKENDLFLVGLGITVGLVLGKVLGIIGAAWLMVRFKLSSLPDGIQWRHLVGAGFLAGIGFTLSLFIAELSFTSAAFLDAAKMSILIASFLAAVCGVGYLLFVSRPKKA